MAFTPNDPTGLSEFTVNDLALPDAEGRPPTQSRLVHPNQIRTLYSERIREDRDSAVARAQVDSIIDGAPPMNQAVLNATGQGSRANANFLMGLDILRKVDNGYIDVFTSPRYLVTVELDGAEDPSEKPYYQRVIATELSRTIRRWPSFLASAMRLVNLFDRHGVGISYFPDTRDFRFEVCGLGDFQFERQVPASEEKVPYVITRKSARVTEMHQWIADPEKARKLGWNPEAVRAAIGRATTAASNGEIGEIEAFQQQVKNNDLMVASKFTHVDLLYMFVQEFDGTWSLAMTEKDNASGDYLFKELSRFKSVEQLFTVFCYGIGNGTYHSIRGLGHIMFPLCALHNRLMNQAADAAMLDQSLIVQADSGNAFQEMSMHQIGAFSVLSPGLQITKQQFSSSGASMPLLGEVKNLMGQFSDRFMAPPSQNGQAYQNKLDVENRLEAMASGDSGAIDLFYAAYDRLMREVCRRIITGPSTDPLVREFKERCSKAGVTKEQFDRVDHASTTAFRSFGAGSPAARSLGFKRLLELMPQLSEEGRKRLIFEFVSDVVGYQNASQFANLPEDMTYNSEMKTAQLENVLLMMGHEIPVNSGEMHATHAQEHLPVILQTLESIEIGEVDPIQSIPGLRSSLNHLSGHGEHLIADPTQAPLYGQVKEAINNIQQVVTNMEREMRADQRKGVEGGAPAEEGQQESDAKAQIEMTKLRMIEFKADLAQRKGELEMAIMQAKADQNLALNDAKAADAIQKKMQYPRSDYGQRR